MVYQPETRAARMAFAGDLKLRALDTQYVAVLCYIHRHRVRKRIHYIFWRLSIPNCCPPTCIRKKMWFGSLGLEVYGRCWMLLQLEFLHIDYQRFSFHIARQIECIRTTKPNSWHISCPLYRCNYAEPSLTTQNHLQLNSKEFHAIISHEVSALHILFLSQSS